MKQVVSVDNMRKSDAFTIKNLISGRELMFRAGEGIYESVSWRPPVAIVCGSGNNAGDGFVVADLLKKSGKDCKIFLISEKFTPDGKFYFENCIQNGINYALCDENTDFCVYNTILDCIFGTGFTGEPRGLAAKVIEKINESRAYVVSADINSGLDGDNGLGNCVRSDLTVSVGYFKSGHFLNKAKDVIGELKNCDIGISLVDKPYYLFEREDCRACFPTRKHFSHKGTYGYIALIGGSTEYCGAVKLANLAASAMRSGAGVVKLACPKSIVGGIMPYILESTLFPLSDIDGKIVFSEEELRKLTENVKSVAIGMGIGKSDEIKKILRFLLGNYSEKLIIDADALNCLAEMDPEILAESKPKVILTPHVKEFSRLTGLTTDEILENPIDSAKSFAKEHNVTVLLKGPTTIITDGDKVLLTDRGCPGMATAGSGDVLSGILAAVCGFSDDPIYAAATAAFVNGYAGEIAQKNSNPVSATSGDTAACIAESVTEILNVL